MKNIPAGIKPPQIVYNFVEIPKGSSNKYEFDHQKEVFKLDRALYSAVFYPTEYGFIPSTLAEDGDPLDIMTITTYPTFPGCLLAARVIGGLEISDNNKKDYKIISVFKDDPRLKKINKITDLPPHFRKEIIDFWENYARLQPKKDIKVGKWLSLKKAEKIIQLAIKRYQNENE
ncbi:inorganic diphosphatase [bacterium]|nr:inorganic diphosphatase [bacterium]